MRGRTDSYSIISGSTVLYINKVAPAYAILSLCKSARGTALWPCVRKEDSMEGSSKEETVGVLLAHFLSNKGPRLLGDHRRPGTRSSLSKRRYVGRFARAPAANAIFTSLPG
jgi:hypothetical protein